MPNKMATCFEAQTCPYPAGRFSEPLRTPHISALNTKSPQVSSTKGTQNDAQTGGDACSFDLETAKGAIELMGLPGHLVDQLVMERKLDGISPFASIAALFTAVDSLADSPQLQADLAKKLYDADEEERLRVKEEERHQRESETWRQEKEEASRGKIPRDKRGLNARMAALARRNAQLRERKVCRACRLVPLSTSGATFLPCGHFVTCEACADTLTHCVACGHTIVGTVRTFLS